MAKYNTVTYERKARIAYIMLNRPEALNAISNELESELRTAFLEFDVDDDAWVAILHGAGRCFCAGADMKSHSSFGFGMTAEEKNAAALQALREGHVGGAMNMRGTGGEGWLGRTANYKPVIAAVHGHALAGGAHLAAECDLVVASEDASFGITETKVGLSGSRTWVKLKTYMPSKIASEMLMTGRGYSAALLHQHGFINRLVPNGKHLEAAEELANEVLKAPPLSVRDAVRVTRKQWVNEATDLDAQMQLSRLDLSEDCLEAGRAFVEKRAPVFKAK
jgi:enoyl-CoA hydratase/carnithine racemase